MRVEEYSRCSVANTCALCKSYKDKGQLRQRTATKGANNLSLRDDSATCGSKPLGRSHKCPWPLLRARRKTNGILSPRDKARPSRNLLATTTPCVTSMKTSCTLRIPRFWLNYVMTLHIFWSTQRTATFSDKQFNGPMAPLSLIALHDAES